MCLLAVWKPGMEALQISETEPRMGIINVPVTDAHGLVSENWKALTWRSCFQTCWSF